MPTPRDEQRKYKFTTKNGQFFEELKFNQEPSLSNQKSATMLKISSKVWPKIIPKEYLNSKPKP